ncbi:putative pectinesterase inhibitor domain-containing protein [Rosa chinensis]|uniref:Putative pectinesterase inhibitor domain-containing protein n=1 Tax=Rosa chinensis TaxID=74649 RepID=A0A2P6SED9_ROSCH|nr:putative invertase inhibitor [Rosa chinensis]PRQ57051.1 putative pectinesterase inhibitor domain-containing protein [Rosa chinensis]
MTTPIFTFTFLPLFLLFSSTFTPITANNVISEICKKCAQEEYTSMSYKFCVTSLQADPNSQGADLRQLGLISMKLVKNNVTNTRRFIKNLLKNEELDKFVRMCLDDCLDLYTDAITSIKQAVKDYKMKDNRHANLAVSSVAGAATTCEDGFEETPGLVSPLTKRNNEMSQLCDIALMIITMVSSSFY